MHFFPKFSLIESEQYPQVQERRRHTPIKGRDQTFGDEEHLLKEGHAKQRHLVWSQWHDPRRGPIGWPSSADRNI